METFTPKKRYGEDQDSSEGINICPSESISSTIFPWRKAPSRRHFMVSRSETGHQVQSSAFYLCFLSVLLLCSGILVTGGSVWSILYRIPYSYIFNKSLIIDAGNFNLCGGLICFPCSWIAWTSHDSRRNYLNLPLLILLLAFSMTMLSTGATLGIINRLKIPFQTDSYPPILEDGAYKSMLTETLSDSMGYYGKTFNSKHSWDKIQRRLQCCGINTPDDWIMTDKQIPQSCFHKVNLIYKDGCINLIAHDIAWQICMLTGFSVIVFGIEGITMLLTTFLYIKEKQARRYNRQIELVMTPL